MTREARLKARGNMRTAACSRTSAMRRRKHVCRCLDKARSVKTHVVVMKQAMSYLFSQMLGLHAVRSYAVDFLS